MTSERKPDTKRGEMAFIFAILMGLALGILIKKVKLGVILGILVGSAIVFLGWVRASKK